MNKTMPVADECELREDDLTQVDEMGQKKSEIVSEIKKVIVGQDKVIEEILIALFCRGPAIQCGSLTKPTLERKLAFA